MKDENGKLDLTLVPWKYVSRSEKYELVEPFEHWFRDIEINCEMLLSYFIGQWEIRGRDLILDMAESLNYGAVKYSPWSWESGLSKKQIYAAVCRHYYAIDCGERLDPESGLDHHSHLAFYVMAVIHSLEKQNLGE